MAKVKIKKNITLDLELLWHNDLSFTEWVLLEQISFLSATKGYCYAKRETLADALKISVRGLQKMVKRLIENGLIERVGRDGLKVTEKWLELQTISEKNQSIKHEQSSPLNTNKVHLKHEQSSPLNTNKVHPLTIKTANKKFSKEDKKNYIKKRFREFLKNLEIAFGNLAILTLRQKITQTDKTKDEFSKLDLEALDLSDLAMQFALYVQANKKFAARLDKWLVAYRENNLDAIDYTTQPTTNNQQKDAIDEYFDQLEANSSDAELIEAEVVQ